MFGWRAKINLKLKGKLLLRSNFDLIELSLMAGRNWFLGFLQMDIASQKPGSYIAF